MAERTAVIVGSTGAVGRQLMPLLLAAPHFDRVLVLHRRPTPYAGMPKVEEQVVDFANLPSPPAGSDLEAVFCCVGTTQKRAGSTEAFQKVDRDIPIALARWSADNAARTFVAVSSVGARARSASIYLRTKGEMEEAVAGAGLSSVYILRPSVLSGERDEVRLAERVADRALSAVAPLLVGPLRKYRAINTKTVARGMLACGSDAAPGLHILESDEIEELGG